MRTQLKVSEPPTKAGRNLTPIRIRDILPEDEVTVNRVSLSAYREFNGMCTDWPSFERMVANVASFASESEIIVALVDGSICGVVAYLAPGVSKRKTFPVEWAVIRRLGVKPEARGKGIGRLLTEECICRALRDDADAIALYTNPVMEVALGMYLRMGFVKDKTIPDVFPLPSGRYVKRLRDM
jgi:ribosomal protein S18 acetylase RimI-like enzyme